jgi:hypothetical protein
MSTITTINPATEQPIKTYELMSEAEAIGPLRSATRPLKTGAASRTGNGRNT